MARRIAPPREVSLAQGRQFLLRATGIERPFATTAEAIRHLGYIQMDPIDVCGRMHDLILRNRVVDYRRDGLLETIYAEGPREFFEHYIPGRGILVAMPVTEYPFFVAAMKARRTKEGYGGAMSAAQQKMARRILRRIADEGPLSSAAFLDGERAETGWGTTGSLAKTTLDKLFFHGRLLIARREKFRRIYDLPERVLPEEIRKARPASAKAVIHWLTMERLRQRRLIPLTSPQLALVGNAVTALRLDGGGLLYCLKEDAVLFDEGPIISDEARLLAPLDPVIYNREVARRIWSFDYTWEVYTPAAKRVRGYYALPFLADLEIIGHVDPRADRASGTLVARTNIPDVRAVQQPLQGLTEFLGLRENRLEIQAPIQTCSDCESVLSSS